MSFNSNVFLFFVQMTYLLERVGYLKLPMGFCYSVFNSITMLFTKLGSSVFDAHVFRAVMWFGLLLPLIRMKCPFLSLLVTLSFNLFCQTLGLPFLLDS